MHYVLAINASGTSVSVALASNEGSRTIILGAQPTNSPLRTALDVVEQAGLEARRIDCFAFATVREASNNYTRAIAAMKSLALANAKPVVVVSGLAATAFAASARKIGTAILVCVEPANDGKLFAGFYASAKPGDARSLAAEGLMTPREISSQLLRLRPAAVSANVHRLRSLTSTPIYGCGSALAALQRHVALAELPGGNIVADASHVARLAASHSGHIEPSAILALSRQCQ